MVYVTWLFVVEPHVLRGQANQVALLIFAPGSLLQMVDGLGYTFMGVATFFAAPVFAGKRLDTWIRWLCLLYGLGALMVFLSYVFYIIPLGAGWFIFPPLAAVVWLVTAYIVLLCAMPCSYARFSAINLSSEPLAESGCR